MSYILDAIKKTEHENNSSQLIDYDIENSNNKSVLFWLSLIMLLLLLVVIF